MCAPGPDGGLQQGAQPRYEEDGGDEVALGGVVVPYAEGLCQDEGHGDDAPERQDVMLGGEERQERGGEHSEGQGKGRCVMR